MQKCINIIRLLFSFCLYSMDCTYLTRKTDSAGLHNGSS
uniref:Uncharacterized protein n=1 Tax=Arundo donax TaxID=35708 RepID=A0A0A9E7N4_ARUDO